MTTIVAGSIAGLGIIILGDTKFTPANTLGPSSAWYGAGWKIRPLGTRALGAFAGDVSTANLILGHLQNHFEAKADGPITNKSQNRILTIVDKALHTAQKKYKKRPLQLVVGYLSETQHVLRFRADHTDRLLAMMPPRFSREGDRVESLEPTEPLILGTGGASRDLFKAALHQVRLKSGPCRGCHGFNPPNLLVHEAHLWGHAFVTTFLEGNADEFTGGGVQIFTLSAGSPVAQYEIRTYLGTPGAWLSRSPSLVTANVPVVGGPPVDARFTEAGGIEGILPDAEDRLTAICRLDSADAHTVRALAVSQVPQEALNAFKRQHPDTSMADVQFFRSGRRRDSSRRRSMHQR